MMKTSERGAPPRGKGRNIVVCCDGTGCDEDHTTGQFVTPSNVLKIFNCVDISNVNTVDESDGDEGEGGDEIEKENKIKDGDENKDGEEINNRDENNEKDELNDGEEKKDEDENGMDEKKDGGKSQVRDQVAFYEKGVATVGNVLSRAGAGLTGYGIATKIMIMYHWLGCNWKTYEGDEEDRLFLFGFSRGAFAVRSLMGMIYRVGLLDLSDLDAKESHRRVSIAFNKGYKNMVEKSKWAKGSKTGGKKNNDPWLFHGGSDGRIPLHFLGLFDTVGQLGLPRETWCLWTCGILCFFSPGVHKFHDVLINETVRNARHLVAIDEMRSTFQPVFDRGHWNRKSKMDREKQSLKQVWFPGCHGNVGGGLLDTGLSDGALKYMIEEASKKGLRFQKKMVDQIRPDPKGNIYYTHGVSVYKNLTFYPRSVPAVIPANTDPDLLESIHSSAIQRSEDPPVSDAPYFNTKYLQKGETHAVSIRADKIYNRTSVYLETGATYKMTAAGRWSAFRDKLCGPEGYGTTIFTRPIGLSCAVGMGRLQRGWRTITRNGEANLPLTRRHDHHPWFSVMGMIATGGTRNAMSEADFHTIIGIGKEVEYQVSEKSGYLYCYANDAWGSYNNNKGSVELTIERLN